MKSTFRLAAISVALLFAAALQAAEPAQHQRKPDLADAAQGTYHGEVISDARGASRSDVDVTVTRVGKNTVEVSADYARIPARTFHLTRAMNTIQQASGTEVFLLDLAKTPRQLDLTIDDASWSGTKD
ncbi:MAG: hypothetical protein JSR27_03130 [Proteobacteria bacterium]|nr:hypothetical protein [Pseudomonadota bacterium]